MHPNQAIQLSQPTGAQGASKPEITVSEALPRVRIGYDLHEALSDMTEREVSDFLIHCAQSVNAAAKRNDMEAVHALVHAEASALIELHSRVDYFGFMGERDRQRMEGRASA